MHEAVLTHVEVARPRAALPRRPAVLDHRLLPALAALLQQSLPAAAAHLLVQRCQAVAEEAGIELTRTLN